MPNRIAISLIFLLAILQSCFGRKNFTDYGPCKTDHDCDISRHRFCSNSTCVPLIPAGRKCIAHSQCASSSVVPNACSDECYLESKCQETISILSFPHSTKCCLPIPEGNQCLPTRQNADFSECDRQNGFKCLASNEDESVYTCKKRAEDRWIIGVALTIGGGLITNLGLQFQKKAFMACTSTTEPSKPILKNPFWISGFFLFLAGNAGSFIALKFAAQSLLAPLGVISLISTAIFAPIVNNEPRSKRDILAIAVIIAGSVLVVLFANRSEADYSLCTLLSLINQLKVIILLVVTHVILIALAIAIKVIETNAPHMQPIQDLQKPHDQRFILARWWAVISNGYNRLFNFKSLYIEPKSYLVTYILPLAYANIGGLMGSLTILFGKSSLEILELAITESEKPMQIGPYLLMAATAVYAIGQVYYINAGLSKFDAMLQVPIYFVSFLLSSIICGGIYFDDFAQFTIRQFVFFFTGIFVTVLGVVLLTLRVQSSSGSTKSSLAESISGYSTLDRAVRYSLSSSATACHVLATDP